METETSFTLLDRLLDAALGHAAFDGWYGSIIEKAAADVGLTGFEANEIAPRGAIDLVLALSDRADNAMEQALAAPEAASLKVRAKATLAVRSRLEAMQRHKEAVRRAALFLALPQHAPDAARMAWTTADRAWRALGDTSTDFNFYSKRSILMAVNAATVARWLQDDSLDHAETWAFLDARIANIMQFEKLKARANGVLDKLPDPIGLLAKLRYGR